MENKKVKVELIVENHSSEYELQNIVNIFKPYMGVGVKEDSQGGDPRGTNEADNIDYIVISRVDKSIVSATVSARVLKGNWLMAESSLDIMDKGMLDIEKEDVIRQGLKKTLYTVLSQVTGREMPWGVLTGIRPTKVVHNYKKRNDSETAINEKLIEDYCISREKTSLMMEIASKEEEVLSQNKENEISLYIGIPFCPTRCLYCSFTSYSLKEKGEQVDAYLDALIKEIHYVSKITKGRPVRSLYIGGGTPTSLDHKQLERLLMEIEKCFAIEEIEEYTVEAGRPDTIDRAKLRLMKQYQVGRISINPQTMSQKTLDAVGRSHRVEDIVSVFRIAREEGHQNINMDLIIGLPGESPSDVANTMEELQKLKPDSITVHTMAIKKGLAAKRRD